MPKLHDYTMSIGQLTDKKSKKSNVNCMKNKKSKSISVKSDTPTKVRYFLLAILLVNVFVYYPSIKCGFVDWDDTVYVTENPNIALNSKNVVQSFTQGESHGVYAPITALSLSINYSQSKFNPKPYHITNIILHLFAVIIAFMLLFTLSNNLLFTTLATLIFSLHPVQIESVTYIAGRRDLLFSLFALISMLFYAQFKLQKRTKWIYISIAFYILSLMSKTQALLFPFLLFAFDYVMGIKLFTRKNILEKIPFIILMIIFGIITVNIKQASQDFKITDEVLQIPILERLIYGIYGYVMYLYQILIPNHLSLIHPYPNTIPNLAYVAIACLVALLFWGYWLYKKDKKTTLFGLLFFSINLVLMLQLFPNSYGLINDHYLYLPIIGIGIIIAHFVSTAYIKYRSFATSVVGIYILVMAITTMSRIEVFNDPISVNTDVITKYPDSYVAYNNRGTAYYNKKDPNAAIHDFEMAIKLNPTSAFSLNNRAVIYIYLGKADLALIDLNKAIKIKLDYADAYSNRAIAKTFVGNGDILSDHNRAIELRPNQPKYLYNRGAFYLQHGKLDQGCADVQMAKKMGLKQLNPMVEQMCP